MFVAVLPALEPPAAPDPLFVIAGGPGQAATSMAEFASKAFSHVRRHRDSDVPALLVSGALDPNTNERWGNEAARYLTRATHVVIPNLSHGFSSVSECGANFIADFIAAASARNVDFSCKDRVRLPPFALGAQ